MNSRGSFFQPIGLRAHSAIVGCSLVLLTAILGARGYAVARSQFRDMERLVSVDISGQEQLARLESFVSARDRALRREHQALAAGHRVAAELRRREVAHFAADGRQAARGLRELLAPAYPELASTARALTTREDLGWLREELSTQRLRKLGSARNEALGLLRMIVLAFFLSLAITAWVLYLFRHGLLEPLGRLRDAVARVRAGDWTTRVPPDQGISELRELTRSFNAMATRLEALDLAKAEFLATVSHEFKNPLTALKEGLGLLAYQGEELPAAVRGRALGACLIASKRLEAMMNNLLAASSLDRGAQRLEVSLRDLREPLQGAIDEVRLLADKRGMSILADLSPDADLRACFNADGFHQVFENLLFNAIKYGDEGSVISVTARAVVRPLRGSEGPPVAQAEVAVINRGRPLDAHETERVFERFYRGQNAGARGLGVGLHIVKQIVEAHFGEVAAIPLADGMCFRVRLPHRPRRPLGAPEDAAPGLKLGPPAALPSGRASEAPA